MNIKLERSLAIFDLEATGLNITKDRIVEIAIIKINPDGSREDYHKRINPQIPIPNEVSAIHGIHDEDIKDEPVFADILDELMNFMGDADIAGYNSNKFDLPLLAEEILRTGKDIDLSSRKHIDVQNIFHKMEQRTLIAAYKFYCEKDLTNAHNAFADAEATWEVLDAQISRYANLKENVGFLAEFSKHGDVTRVDFAGRLALNENNQVIYNFGKHKSKTVEEVLKTEPGYYGWMLHADFPLYTKQCLRKEMDRIKAERSAKDSNLSIDDKLDALRSKFNTKR
jgi:DNA polymerase-3 subunit epsilon